MTASIDSVYAVILAAGASSRMGNPKETLNKSISPMARQAHHERNRQVTAHPEPVEGFNQHGPKQLLKWQNRPLLEHAIQNARALLTERVIVVLGAHAESITSAVDLDAVTAIVNPNWQEGMASSIHAGVRALPASATAVLFLLCDQPLITPTHIQTLLNVWQNEPSRIVASQYNHSVGVPALFPADFFGRLLDLKGDQGAKRLLKEFGDSLLTVPLPEAGFDIDTRHDFDHLTGHYSAEE